MGLPRPGMARTLIQVGVEAGGRETPPPSHPIPSLSPSLTAVRRHQRLQGRAKLVDRDGVIARLWKGRERRGGWARAGRAAVQSRAGAAARRDPPIREARPRHAVRHLLPLLTLTAASPAASAAGASDAASAPVDPPAAGG